MKLIERLKRLYDYLDSIKKPFDKDEEIELIRWTLSLIEDGLTWDEIREHLNQGCHCEETNLEAWERLERKEGEK